MDKTNWLSFLSSKIKSQISSEAVERAQTWALSIMGFLAIGFALTALTGSEDRPERIYGSKILFLFFFQLYALTSFFIPAILQKGQRVISKNLQIRDFTSLTAISSVLGFYSLVAVMLGFQVAAGNEMVQPTAFLAFTGWANTIVCAAAFTGFAFYLTSLFAFPGFLIKWLERGSKSIYAGLGIAAGVLVLTGFGYAGITKIGSTEFFEQFRIAGLFWIFIASSILLTGRLFRESAVPVLSNLEVDLVSGRLERMELVIPRFKDAFVGVRFDHWLKGYAKNVAEKSSEIAKYTKETINLVSVEKPSEMDLRQIEDRYRKAEHLYKQIEKSHQRFMISMVAFSLSEVETEKAALVRDQFSRELRNAKLDLASIRKMIDERLVSLKNNTLKIVAAERQALEELTAKS